MWQLLYQQYYQARGLSMIVGQKGGRRIFIRCQETSLGTLCIVPDSEDDSYSQNTMHNAPIAYNQLLEQAQTATRATNIASTPVVTRIVAVGVVVGESAPDED
jgi:hypothetical protein